MNLHGDNRTLRINLTIGCEMYRIPQYIAASSLVESCSLYTMTIVVPSHVTDAGFTTAIGYLLNLKKILT